VATSGKRLGPPAIAHPNLAASLTLLYLTSHLGSDENAPRHRLSTVDRRSFSTCRSPYILYNLKTTRCRIPGLGPTAIGGGTVPTEYMSHEGSGNDVRRMIGERYRFCPFGEVIHAGKYEAILPRR